MVVFGVQLSELDVFLLGGAGTLLAWFINHRLSMQRENAASVRSAYDRFRLAFAPEISALRELQIRQVGQVHEILQAAYPKHEAALLELEQGLRANRRSLLRGRWMSYRGPYPLAPELPVEDRRYRLAKFIGTSVEDEEAKRNEAIAFLTSVISHP